MKKWKLIAGSIVFVSIIAINLLIAMNYYFLRTVKVGDFYFWQAKENELFKADSSTGTDKK